MDLFSAPYHGNAMLRGYRDVGVGHVMRPAANGFPEFHDITINMATRVTSPVQVLASNEIKTYPCGGATGILSKTYKDEMPKPIAGRNLETQPIGHPIYLRVRNGQTLTLTTSDLREFGANTSETLLPALTSTTDANGLLTSSEVVVIPNSPLKTNANYRFQATGTNNGQAFTVDFTFTTGAF